MVKLMVKSCGSKKNGLADFARHEKAICEDGPFVVSIVRFFSSPDGA